MGYKKFLELPLYPDLRKHLIGCAFFVIFAQFSHINTNNKHSDISYPAIVIMYDSVY